MSPAACTYSGPCGSFPRVSGDEPDPADMCANFLKFSPRERG